MATPALQQARNANQTRSAIESKRSGRVRMLLRGLWRGIRDWCGDSAYERYLSATKQRQSPDAPLTQEKFYVEQLNRRYSRPNRCC